MRNFYYLKLYLQSLIKFSRWRFFLGCALTFLNTLLSGIGLLLLIPLLHYAGWLPKVQLSDDLLAKLSAYLPTFSGKLPLLVTLLIFILIIAFAAAINYYNSCLITNLQQDYLYQLRHELNTRVAHAKWSFLLEQKLKRIEHMLSTGLNQISVLTHYCLLMISECIISILYIIFSLIISFKLTLISGCLALLLFSFLHKSKALVNGQEVFSINQKMHEALSHFLDGIKLAKSYNQVDAYTSHYQQLNQDSMQCQQAFIKNQRLIQFYIRIASAVVFAILFLIAFYFFHISLLALIALLIVYSRLLPRLSMLQQLYLQVLNIVPVFQEEQEMVSEIAGYQEGASQQTVLTLQDEIVMEHITYTHQQNFSIKDLSCTFKLNTTTVIVGHSGAGKSTLADLLLGLLLPTQGQIKIDKKILGIDNVQAWRQLISYVPQEAYFFNESIRQNLLWVSPDADENAIWQALQLAAAKEFVEKLPEGLDSIIGDRGVHLSGGERQRLAIARALLRKPKVLLLDEATSALDAQNEEIIYHTLKQLQGKMTMILIAHRFSTIRMADQILVLEQGKLIEAGNFQQLRKNTESRFMKLFASQITLVD